MAVGYPVIDGKRFKKEAHHCWYEALELCVGYQQVCYDEPYFI
jgi:hypothetical protein